MVYAITKWFVIKDSKNNNVYGNNPTKQHESFESARAEAQRLAKSNTGTIFYVAQIVSHYVTEPQVDEVKYYEKQPIMPWAPGQ